MPHRTRRVAPVVLLAGLALPAQAWAAPDKAAVFPIELLDPGVVGGRKARPEEIKKLALVTEELKKSLKERAGLDPVDTEPMAAEVAKQGPLYRCNGCASDIAKSLGADLAISGYVEKGSNQIFNLYVTIADTATGKVVRGGQVVIRADTDDTWAHAMRWIVKNRLLAEPLPGKS